jgi:A118 family predicted phage portal protein
MLKPYVSGGHILVDIVQADQFYPVTFDASGNITACVFSDQRQVGDKWYTRLEYHTMTDKGCDIINQAFKSSSKDTLGSKVPLGDVGAWADLEPEASITDIKIPLYAYFKYPAANNVDPASPLGVSCYARAIDLIRQADEQWSQLLWEFDSGRRAMYVDPLAFGVDENGKPVLPVKRLYRSIAADSPVGIGKLFEEWSPDFREENILTGLEAILRKVEFNCGLAYGTLSNPTVVDKTATEIKISQQRSYATITDVQKALQDALEQLLAAMDLWTTLESLVPDGDYEVQYDFDDSVIVDKDAQFQQDLRLVTSQVMSKVEFRMRNFNEDEATAQKMLDMIPAPEPGLGLFGGSARQ